MNKDIQRLQLIADRFSKIGALPEPVPASLNEVMTVSYTHLAKIWTFLRKDLVEWKIVSIFALAFEKYTFEYRNPQEMDDTVLYACLLYTSTCKKPHEAHFIPL